MLANIFFEKKGWEKSQHIAPNLFFGGGGKRFTSLHLNQLIGLWHDIFHHSSFQELPKKRRRRWRVIQQLSSNLNNLSRFSFLRKKNHCCVDPLCDLSHFFFCSLFALVDRRRYPSISWGFSTLIFCMCLASPSPLFLALIKALFFSEKKKVVGRESTKNSSSGGGCGGCGGCGCGCGCGGLLCEWSPWRKGRLYCAEGVLTENEERHGKEQANKQQKCAVGRYSRLRFSM